MLIRQYLRNLHQILIKNTRFAPERKLRQISVENIRHHIASQKTSDLM